MTDKFAHQTFTPLQLYRPKSGKQLVCILAQQKDLDSSDVEVYNNDVQGIRAQLIRIDAKFQHHEALAPAFLTSLHDNLNEDHLN